ncbi:MAG: PTS sugar transporter subunit IIA [Rhizobiales bacterium]|nr:PTS sugar transporter subunit IIA [Hyphomicrobiales bacterium]NRB14242.1 PTS sugar transporter subunit IIA [Hyphomicrobiales bacterium]
MEILDFLTSSNVFIDVKAKSKKQILQFLSDEAAKTTDIDQRDIFDALLERERLGSTGVGKGIAIPHAKFKGLTKIVGMFVKLRHEVEFDSIDDKPVDLIFLLMVPENAGADHLTALARISRFMRDSQNIEGIHGAENIDSLYAVLTQIKNANAA